MEKKTYSPNQILKIILSILILAVSLRYIGKIYQPTLLDDEFSYFGIAKYFTGTSWSSVMSLCKYYSYGYSLLIAPFALVIEDTILLYRLTVAMNGIFLIIAFWLLDSIFRQLVSEYKLFDEDGRNLRNRNGITIISFLMIMLPCNMNYASVALGECLLLMLFALMLKILLGLNKKSGCAGYVILGSVMMYSYMVHQRMLGVIIAGVVIFIIRFIRKEVNGKQIISFVMPIVLLYVLHTVIKADIKENLWMNGAMSGENDMSGIMGNIQQIFSSFSYFVKFIVSILGKLFYMGSSTYLFGFVGLILCICSVVKQCKSKKNRPADDGLLFILLSFGMVLGISAIFMNVPENMAFLLYGRYLETFSPFLMGYGLLVLIAERYRIRKYFYLLLSAGIIYGVIGIVIRYFSKRWNLSWLNYISTGQLYRYLVGESVPILRIMLVVIATAGMIYFVLQVKKFWNAAGVLIAVLMFGIFYQTAYIPMNKINLDLQNQRHKTAGITSVIRESISVEGTEKKQIYYYVAEDESNDTAQYREYVQYWLNDVSLNCLLYTEENEWKKLMKGDLILVSCENCQNLKLFQEIDLKLLYENELCGLYCVEKE